MLRQLTELWPNLLGPVRGRANADADDDEAEDPLLAGEDGEDGDDEGENEDAVDENQLLLDYHRLNWTRLMVIGGFEKEQT